MATSLHTDDFREIAELLGGRAHEFSGATVLISGALGFLGRYFMMAFGYLNSHVLEKPCKLIALDNQISSAVEDPSLSGMPNISWSNHDIVQEFEFDQPVDYVIHAAGIASPFYYTKYPLETIEVATVGTKNLLNQALKHRSKGFLFFSSSEIYGDPDASNVPTTEAYRGNVSCIGPRACYDESKRLGETLCTIYHSQFGVPTKIVRPFNVYGPGASETDYRVLPNFASSIKGGRPLRVYKPATQTRTFCYVSDAINGFLRVLLDGNPGEPYNIGNPRPEVSIIDLVAELQAAAQREFEVEFIEPPDTYPRDEPLRRCPDITKARLQLGFHPAVELVEGLSRFLQWTDRHYTGNP